jgi:hypothetical protein
MKYPFTIANYYFKNENLILGIGLGTGTGPQESHILYLINFDKLHYYYNWISYSIDDFNNKIFKNIIKNKNIISSINPEKLESLNITIYGYHNNLGHNLFNDISGLFILDYFSVNKYLNKIILGDNDNFYINNYFQKYSNLIIDKSIKDLNILNSYIGRGIIFKYNHFFLSNKCIDFLKCHLDINFKIENNIYDEINYIKNNFFPIIHIVLRIGTNELINQDIIISEVINKLSNIYPKIYFYLDGLCCSSNMDINSYIGTYPNIKTLKNIINDYNNLVNSIDSKIKNKNYKSLINFESYNIIKYLSISTYSILQISSISCISAWICNIPGIQFGRKKIKIYEKIDSNIRENMVNIKYIYDNIEYFENSYSITSDEIIKLLPNF